MPQEQSIPVEPQEKEKKDLKEELQSSVQNVEEKIDDIRQKVEIYNQKVVDVVTQKPLVAIAGAFIAGYIVGKLAAHRWFV